MIILPFASIFQTPVLPSDSVARSLPSDFPVTTEAVLTVLLTLAVLGVLLALVAVLRQLKTLSGSMVEVANRLQKDAGPIIDRARSVAENVDFITASVRTDVQKVNESVNQLNGRLKQASERMEERIQDFTALVEVLQEEAEDLALDTAAAVRGVRAGTRTLAARNKSAAGDSAAGDSTAGDSTAQKEGSDLIPPNPDAEELDG